MLDKEEPDFNFKKYYFDSFDAARAISWGEFLCMHVERYCRWCKTIIWTCKESKRDESFVFTFDPSRAKEEERRRKLLSCFVAFNKQKVMPLIK